MTPGLGTLLLVLALAAPGQAENREDRLRRQAAQAAIESHLEVEATHLGPRASLMALAALGAHDHPVTVDHVLEVLARDRGALLPTARQVLAGLSRPDSIERLARAGLQHRDARVRSQCLRAAAEARLPGLDLLPIAVDALDDREPLVRAEAVTALGRLRASDHVLDMLERATDPSPRVRARVPEAAVRVAGPRSLVALRGLAEDPSWRVRQATLKALELVATDEAVELLVNRLEVEPGRLREDALAALHTVTGRSFGLSLEAWRVYLAELPDDFVGGAGSGDLTLPGSTARSYWGLSTLSDRLLFVTDLSTSMDQLARTHHGRPHDTRLSVTRDQLARLIEALDESVAFNLVTFSDDADAWLPRLGLATDSVRRRALAVVNGYQTIGGTNLVSALDHVFDSVDRALDGDRGASTHRTAPDTEQGPDTVFLLSDGEPSRGHLQDLELLLDYVEERNRDARLRFHTVSLTASRGNRDFLARLAHTTGGQFTSPVE